MNIPEMTDEQIHDWMTTLAERDIAGYRLVGWEEISTFARAILAARDAQYAAMAGQEPVAWSKDAAEWGNALNAAGWEFDKAYRLHMGEPIIRDVILKYAEKVAASHPAPTNPATQEPAVVARVAGDNVRRFLQWADVAAFDYPIGTPLYTHPAPTNPAAPAEALYDQIKQVLQHHRLTHTMEDEDSGFPLVDMLCPPDSKDIALGKDEITFICDAIFNEVLCLSATPPAPAQPDKYRIKVKGGDWHLSDSLPAACDMDAIEAIEEAAQPSMLIMKRSSKGLPSRPRFICLM